MRYVFGEFSLDTERFELSRAGRPVKLQPKPFRILAYLIAHRDRVVSKDELFAQCWAGRIVGDAALNTAIKTIRRALAGHDREKPIIQTLPKCGYRFVAEVTAAPVEPTPTGTDANEASAADAMAPAPPAEFAREYKNVTVLCGALADAAGLAGRLGPESMDRLMQALFTLTDEVLQHYGGTLLQWLEDGFMALFGAPQAHEDHTRRAVLAALELGRRLATDRPQAPSALTAGLRMGLHSGTVVVSSLTPETGRPYVAASATVRLARQLQRQAAPGVLLISTAARKRVRAEFQVEPVVVADTTAYRVLGVRARHAGVPQREACHLTPFVGRERELEILHERLTHAAEGQGQTVTIVGEPGIGKSRLLRQFYHSLGGVHHYQGHCLPYAVATAYLPVRELIRQLCGIDAAGAPAAVAQKAPAALARAGIGTPEATALLLRFLDGPADRAVLAHFSPQAQRERTLSLLGELLLHSHPAAPCLITIEDIHWIDVSSEEWLARLAQQLAVGPMLLLLTHRPEYRPAWLESSWVTRLALPPLTAQASLDLVRSVPRKPVLSDELARDIAARAGGNPFFLEELTWTLDAGATTAAIPDTVQGVLAARIDRLAPDDKRLLQTAAVIGTSMPLALLAAVSGCPEAAFRQGLERLQRSEFLFETRAGGDRACAFKHALTRDVAYQSLLHSARQRLHEKTARLIEARFPDLGDQQPELLARHYTAAGLHREAVDHWQRAGRQAYEHSASPEAIEHVRRGLQVVSELPDDSERARWELRLQMTLGSALMVARGYAAPEVEHAWARARTLCQQLGDSAALFKALIGLWNFHWVRGQSGAAVDAAQQLLALAQAAQDPVALLRAHAALGEILFHTGRLAEARQHLDQGVRFYRLQARHSHATDAPSVACLCYSAWSLWHLGYPDQALANCKRALELARVLKHPFSLAIALCLTAELHQFRRESAATLALAEEGIELSREQGFPFWEGTGRVLWGWARAVAGQYDAGLDGVHRGLAVFRATGAEVQLSSWYGLLAEAYACAGRIEPGLQAVEEALGWVARTGEHYYESELLRLQGGLLYRYGSHDRAEHSYQRALTVARRQQARSRELRAAVDLGRLWQAQGRGMAAHRLLKPLCDGFAEERDSSDMQHARALMAALV